MTREEFHRIYEQMPEHFRAELIGGTVFVASPLRRAHGTIHALLTGALVAYQGSTPGVECSLDTTILLDDEAEPQPDLFLRILPEFGGQSKTTSDDYVEGAPELVCEIAHSSRAIDLHMKREDYARNGVQEYLVVSLGDGQLHGFNLHERKELQPDAEGVYRMRVFPGLWIDGPALLAKDHARLMATLHRGLATPEHADFVARLAAAKR